jgi:adenylate cyclase
MTQDTQPAAPARRQAWFLGSRSRKLRLASGTVLFVYVLTHLLNHAALNISVDAADRVLIVQKFIWQGSAGTALLYMALTLHAALGIWSLYARRAFRWYPSEAWQLALGLAIPALLANHIAVTRAALTVYGLDKTYIAELDALYVHGFAWHAGDAWGAVQLALLIAAWTHACLGLLFLFRLRRWFAAWQPALLTAAILIPVLALLGFAAGGREVARALADPAFRLAHLPITVTGDAAQKASLAHWRNIFLAAYAALLAAAILARGVRTVFEHRLPHIVVHYPGRKRLATQSGLSILEASRLHGIPHASICGGKGRCSTCRIRILWSARPLPTPALHERSVLQNIGADPNLIRLACQLRPRADLSVAPLIPPEVAGDFVLGRTPRIPGDERFLAVMFIDMRGSSSMAERRMPFDSVFLLGRFIAAATRATVDAGGRPVQFLGDGLLALFGLETDAATACRQSLAAIASLEQELAALDPLFGQETGEPLRYGVGLHCGRAIVGEIGFGRHVAFTALGETVNLAHRLQEHARDAGATAVISSEVFQIAGADATQLREIAVTLRGRNKPPLLVRLVERACADQKEKQVLF